MSGSFWLTPLGAEEVTVKPNDEMRGIFLQSSLCSAQNLVFAGLGELFAHPGNEKSGMLP